MNKENSRNAAGLRRSAIVERIRLREEWSALKEIDTATTSKAQTEVKKPVRCRTTPAVSSKKKLHSASQKKGSQRMMQLTSDALRGVVALVDVGGEGRALPLRCALAALGATVVIEWSPLVTHLVWTVAGSRATRAKARALACRLVSPLWVEACAAAAERLPERRFPAAARHSDLPSPRTLRQLLKKAERENVPLVDLLSDSKEDNNNGCPKLRISSETDTSTDKSQDSSRETVGIESRVNTAPRGQQSPIRGGRSRRKLFTHKEGELATSGDESEDERAGRNKLQNSKLTQRDRRDLARAERMAKRLLAECNTQRNQPQQHSQNVIKPKIVLTGMSRQERQAITRAIQALNGVIQKAVTKRTTHVLLGSCRNNTSCSNHPSNITGITSHCDLSKSSCWSDAVDKRARTVNALLGAARGCRLLHARWALDSASAGKWIHPHGYDVQHLKRICQKARVERSALGLQRSDYAYDVFNGMRIHITPDADQRDAAIQLLTLCGGIVQNGGQDGGPTVKTTQDGGRTVNVTQNGRPLQDGGRAVNLTQNGRRPQDGVDYDVIIGSKLGEVNSKWVFDSVAIARMRTTRRYINMNSFTELQNSWQR
ncbi:unnamed protein product [Chrysodeixis includens]|uniref:BRCT domain-containing protein n=1 Tax=Chrysodeixis includens TaxID=689277 RepID=A0A9P0BVV5_CHRIL|nr:unnamed protein product [Chrysodeixis includens]